LILENCARPGQQIAILANAIAVALSKGLTPNEENVIGNLITQIGSTLLSIAAIDEANENSDAASTNSTANCE
jgi:hypothetical protein